MRASRERQVRLERKGRRREERRRGRRELVRPALPAATGESEWSQTLVLTRDGRPPDPGRLEAFAALGTLSDALLRLMEPYVHWPPAPDELEDLEAWLQLGAAVWNATVRATTGEQLRAALESVVDEWELRDEDDPVRVVREIASRKLRLFADDYRVAAGVRVKAEDGRATVEAVSLAHLR